MGECSTAVAAIAWCAWSLGCGDAARPALTQRGEPARPDLDASTTEVAPECTGDAQCTIDRACRTGRCVGGACLFDFADDGARCDDGDPCTPIDRCSTGECRGAGALDCGDDDACTDDRCRVGVGCAHGPRACDDGDACTSDTCRAEIGCVAAPIVCAPVADPCLVTRCDARLGCVADPIPGCAADPACVGVDAGGPCDDDDAETTADLCLAGRCRGFRLTRLAGESAGDDVALHEVDADGWSVVLSASGALGVTRWALGALADAGVIVDAATTQATRFRGLDGTFVGDEAGRVWQLTGDGWTADNGWDTALGLSGRAAIHTLATVGRDSGARFVWLAGGADWARVCKADGPGLACGPQALADLGAPVALAAIGLCDETTCRGATLALGVDRLLGGGFNTTSVATQANGLAPAWTAAFVPEAPAFRATRAAVGWRSDDTASFAIVGDRGYLVLGLADDWQGPIVARDGQATRDFVGVAVAADALVIAAHRAVGLGQTAFELWTAPRDRPADGWVVHELGRFDTTTGDGLADVEADGGDVRAVGAVRREGLLGGVDGAVWRRDE